MVDIPMLLIDRAWVEKEQNELYRFFGLPKLPELKSEGAAGFDLAYYGRDINLGPLGSADNIKVLGTGLRVQLPYGFELQVRPRSGLASKYGITVLNSPGTIDSDYRGEIKVILINHSHERFYVSNGDRIAQAVYAPVWSTRIEEGFVDINSTDRGISGFGSTGIA